MVITRLSGGIGNQLFQYAAGRMLALKNNDVLKLDIAGYTDPRTLFSDYPRAYTLQHYNIKAQIATPEEIRKIKYPYGFISKLKRAFNKKILRKFYRDYHPEIFSWKGDVYLDGFFQSEKYFADSKNIILEDFRLTTPLSDVANKLKESITQAEDGISLHVRRGDIVSDPNNFVYHRGCSIEYYKKALEVLRPKLKSPHIFLFSDDIEWVKENIILDVPTTAISCPDLKDYEELYLMSQCKHNIISNSTFSWWAAWLNPNQNKMVISPDYWATNPLYHPNIHPPTWIKI